MRPLNEYDVRRGLQDIADQAPPYLGPPTPETVPPASTSRAGWLLAAAAVVAVLTIVPVVTALSESTDNAVSAEPSSGPSTEPSTEGSSNSATPSASTPSEVARTYTVDELLEVGDRLRPAALAADLPSPIHIVIREDLSGLTLKLLPDDIASWGGPARLVERYEQLVEGVPLDVVEGVPTSPRAKQN